MNKLRIIAVAAGILSSTMGMSAASDGKVHLKGQLIGMGTTSVKMQYDGAAAIVATAATSHCIQTKTVASTLRLCLSSPNIII